VLCVFLLAYIIPDRRQIPVQGATQSDWNANTFWFEPWGSSGVHKGIDIFATNGTPVLASTNLLILSRRSNWMGGNVILGLGPKWRLHYFAHLGSFTEDVGIFVSTGQQIGTVGDTGNARGKPAHLHYSILSMVPMPWLADDSTQGHKKAFYLNPIEFLGE